MQRVTELRVENFKSFGSGSKTLFLHPLNFIVGANASGKTNLISALRFLKLALLGNVESAAGEFGGPEQVQNRTSLAGRSANPLRIRVKIEGLAISIGVRGLPPRQIRSIEYEAAIDLCPKDGLPAVESEKLQAEIHGPEVNGPYVLRRTRQKVEINDTAFERGKREIPIPETDLNRLVAGTGFFSRPCAVFRSQIERWSFFDINADLARAPAKEVAEPDLGWAGEHLAAVLHKIEEKNGKSAIRAIVDGLRGAVPGFKGIRTRRLPVEGSWVFQVVEEHIRGAINPRSISDGTIRLLALMVVARWSGPRSTLLAIEEPENGLHPYLAPYVIELLRTASQTRQVFVTTHNPGFLNELNPEEVILCDKEKGFTILRHASDVAAIKSFRKHFRLGELWEQGTLGGIP